MKRKKNNSRETQTKYIVDCKCPTRAASADTTRAASADDSESGDHRQLRGLQVSETTRAALLYANVILVEKGKSIGLLMGQVYHRTRRIDTTHNPRFNVHPRILALIRIVYDPPSVFTGLVVHTCRIMRVYDLTILTTLVGITSYIVMPWHTYLL